MKKIALDVDGVLLSFMPAFDRAAKELLGKDLPINKDEFKLDHYHLGKRINATDEDVTNILNYMITSGMYARLDPLPEVKEALDAIKKENFKIYIVTALPEAAKAMRLLNLQEKLDLVPDEIYCVGMGKSKADALNEIKPDIFIDDRIDYLASSPTIYHLVWIDQKESQKDTSSMVDVHVHSLKEWTDNHMPRVVKKLDRFYQESTPVQIDLKLESHTRKYGTESNKLETTVKLKMR